MKQLFLEVGRILSTHALSGEMKFEHWGDDDSTVRSLSRVYLDREGKEEKKIRSLRAGTKHLLLRLEGVNNVDDAAKLRMKTLYARREDLTQDENTVFWADLIGSPVKDAETGRLYGKIRDVYNRGASDIWEIETENGPVLFPAAPVFVKTLSATDGATITPPEDLF